MIITKVIRNRLLKKIITRGKIYENVITDIVNKKLNALLEEAGK